MSQPPPEFVAHCLELLSPLGTARAKRMFGGYGVYVDDRFIAIVAFELLYFKVDDSTRHRFEAAGCEPFSYATRQGQHVALSYYTAPEEALESPALMLPWARLALQAALVAAAQRPAPRAAAPRKAAARKTSTRSAEKPASRPAGKVAAARRTKRPA